MLKHQHTAALVLAAAAASVSVACSDPPSVVGCSDSTVCTLFPGGQCLPSPTGFDVCAYPDTACPSGFSWSPQAGGLAGECVPNDNIDASTPDSSVDAGPDAPIAGNWVKIVGGTMIDTVDAIAVAADGTVIVAASFQGTVDVGGGPLSATDYDILLARFMPTGEHVWSRRYGGAGTQGAYRLELTSGGDIVIAGTYTGSFTLGTTTLNAAGMADVFVARLSPTGDPIWAVSGGSSTQETITDLSIDAGDNVIVCGEFQGSGSFFGGPSISASSFDVYLARLSSAGAHSWSKKLGNSAIDTRCGVATAANGDVLMLGDFVDSFSAGGATFNSTTNMGVGTRDIYIARFAAGDGGHVWSIAPSGTGQENAYDAHVNGTAVYIVGSFNGSLSLGGSPLSSPTSQDAFVGKLAVADGAHLFSTRIGGPGLDRALLVDTRSDGGVAVGGDFRDTVNFGGTNVSSNGDADAFVADLDPSNGSVLGVRAVGGGSRDTLLDIDNQADHALISGSFSNMISILGGDYTSAGLLDGFVVRIRR